MKIQIVILLMVLASCTKETKYKYGLTPTTFQQYQEKVQKDPEMELVDLEKVIPGLELDIRYATTNNFTGEVIYNLAKAYARKPVAEALALVQADLKAQGLELKIHDGYRPYSATVKFYEVYGDTTFVASPYQGSRHNRGCAIDLTVIDSETKQELNMPTPYDSFQEEAFPDFPLEDMEAVANRTMLIAAMEKRGFKVYDSEWWHFDFVGWEKFDVMDIDFEELTK
ncbi:MAG TPA: M15 family metallopeptidase [Cyclobacteriaceae bacterium]|nr:M15 family metallopeptidase [Cyclobacteriaceae bacterium]